MTNVCIEQVIGKSLYLEPQYMFMICCVRVFVCTHESINIVNICACVCMRFHIECVYVITRRCSLACVNTCASTYVWNAVSESSFRACGRGHA